MQVNEQNFFEIGLTQNIVRREILIPKQFLS